MAASHRPDSLPHARCEHLKAEATGTAEARQLPDGRWRYSTSYHCPDCGESFVETHESTLKED